MTVKTKEKIQNYPEINNLGLKDTKFQKIVSFRLFYNFLRENYLESWFSAKKDKTADCSKVGYLDPGLKMKIEKPRIAFFE